jgi:hypothetical protein
MFGGRQSPLDLLSGVPVDSTPVIYFSTDRKKEIYLANGHTMHAVYN